MTPKEVVVPKENDEQSLPAEHKEALAAVKRYMGTSRANSTWRAYRSDWTRFLAWCTKMNFEALPADPKTVAMFIAQESAKHGYSVSSLRRRISAIRMVHIAAEHEPNPCESYAVREVMKGIKNDREDTKPKKKTPALSIDISKMVDSVRPQSRLGLRDRALILFGFAAAFRRSELVALKITDLRPHEKGYLVDIPRSKTDQEGEGQTIAVPRLDGSEYCPVQALDDWITVAEIDEGPIFRRMFRNDNVGKTAMSSQTVALIIKEHVDKIGLDPKDYSAHSLRSGFLTSAAKNRESIFKMADQSRHSDINQVRNYVQDEEKFDDHPSYRFFDREQE